MLTDIVVICTRDRPQDLSRCLRSLLASTRTPSALLVVDSSEGDESRLIFEREARAAVFRTDYLRTSPGLTFQRNSALSVVFSEEFDVVHFFDDDVELSATYLDAIVAEFARDQRCVGAYGHVVGWHPKKPARLIERLTLLDSVHPGRVTRGGFSTVPRVSEASVDVEWLSGCCMSYRVSSIGDMYFDETRTGYGLGEDVDFSMRAGRRGILRHVSNASVLHHQSPLNRYSRERMVREAVLHRWSLASSGLGKVSRPLVLFASICQAARFVFNFVRSAGREWEELKLAVSVFRGITDCLRSAEEWR